MVDTDLKKLGKELRSLADKNPRNPEQQPLVDKQLVRKVVINRENYDLIMDRIVAGSNSAYCVSLTHSGGDRPTDKTCSKVLNALLGCAVTDTMEMTDTVKRMMLPQTLAGFRQFFKRIEKK